MERAFQVSKGTEWEEGDGDIVEMSRINIIHVEQPSNLNDCKFVCYKHGLSLIILTKMKKGKGDLEERSEGGKGKGINKRNNHVMYMCPHPKTIVKCMYCTHPLIKYLREKAIAQKAMHRTSWEVW